LSSLLTIVLDNRFIVTSW